jgi:hypothetical protein
MLTNSYQNMSTYLRVSSILYDHCIVYTRSRHKHIYKFTIERSGEEHRSNTPASSYQKPLEIWQMFVIIAVSSICLLSSPPPPPPPSLPKHSFSCIL